MTTSDTQSDVYVETHAVYSNGDHDRFAHYVDKDESLESMVSGNPIIALCGKVWVPSRDPEKFPICPLCKEIYDNLFVD